MTITINSLKKEVEILHKALAVEDRSQQQEQTAKLLFYYDKLIELSRSPNPTEQIKLNREIEEFNAKHPLTADDIVRIEPYRELFEKDDENQ
jgi:hypothetical protein